MALLKKAAALLVCAALLFTLAACGDDSADAVIRVELDSIPKTLDPQLASSESELLVVRNIYEGLFRMDENGDAVNGICTRYTLSDDHLTYTFSLNEAAVWKDKTPVTAQDFVFALRRAVDPITKAPLASTLSCIQNAPQILSGKLAVDQLGVTATDTHTLTIQLTYENPEFLEILASSIAMPCNEAFFLEAAGKYGLERETTLSNGSFRVYSWQDKQMRLNRCTTYAGEYRAKCAAAELSLADTNDTTRAERIGSGSIDLGRITDAELLATDKSRLTLTSFEDVCYMLMVNPASSVGNPHLASIWGRSFDRSRLKSENPYLTVTDGAIPSALTIGGQSYTAQYLYTFPYDPQGAKAQLLDGVAHLSSGKLPSIDLLYPDVPGMKEIVTAVALDWQTGLGAYVNVVALSQQEIADKVSSGDYQIAVLPVSSADGSVVSFLSAFAEEVQKPADAEADTPAEDTGDASSDVTVNRFGFAGSVYDEALAALTAGQYSTESLSLAARCEQLLAENPYITPLVFGRSHFAASGNMKSAYFLPGGMCDLAVAVKKG